jgi:hypothetical protein
MSELNGTMLGAAASGRRGPGPLPLDRHRAGIALRPKLVAWLAFVVWLASELVLVVHGPDPSTMTRALRTVQVQHHLGQFVLHVAVPEWSQVWAVVILFGHDVLYTEEK